MGSSPSLQLPVSVARRAQIFHRAGIALSRPKYCIDKEEKSEQKQPLCSLRAGPIFYRARTDSIFLAALYPREFRRATEAGSFSIPLLLLK